MKQNTNSYARIISIAFIAFFVTGIIMYFFPSEGNVKWLNYKEALALASNQGKPTLLYLTNKYSSVNKIANKSIFSNDTVLAFIESNFVTGRLDLDDKSDAEMAVKRYKVDNGKYSIILDRHGRGVMFLDNSWSAGIFTEFAKKALEYPYFDFAYYDEAKKQSIEVNKPIFMIVTNDYYQNINVNEKLKDEKTLSYINDNFIPIAMMSYEEWDRSILKNYLPSDDPIVVTKPEESNLGVVKFTKSPPVTILIISPENTLLGRVMLEDASADWIAEIEKVLKKSDN